MKIPTEELISILSQFNPWWRNEPIPDLAKWQRAAFKELLHWTEHPPAPRAVMLSGPRQVGKTTLVRQAIDALLKKNVPAANILYATFDHPMIKLAGVDAVIEAWRAREPKKEGLEYLFLDEAQFINEWGTWIKHQVDFTKDRRIIFTGSATTLRTENQESGVGRWHAIRLATLSFYEYTQLIKEKIAERNVWMHSPGAKQITPELVNLLNFSPAPLKELPPLQSLNELITWDSAQFARVIELAKSYIGSFNEYLIHGGFPQIAQISNVGEAQRLLREDIIEKVLKRDMTALYGVRNILELEQVFIYLCMHQTGQLDMQQLSSNLEVQRSTAQRFVDILESAHMIYRLPPYGYGKEVLRGRYKVYLADSSLAPAVLLSGKSVLEHPDKLGVMIETAIFKHLYTHYNQKSLRFTYWQNAKKQEVDLVVEQNDQLIPFEIKYRNQVSDKKSLAGLAHFCKEKNITQGYVVTKELHDFGPSESNGCKIMRIPALLLCYWMGQMEFKEEESP